MRTAHIQQVVLADVERVAQHLENQRQFFDHVDWVEGEAVVYQLQQKLLEKENDSGET